MERGFAALRGNWELALVRLGQTLLVSLVLLAGLAPPIVVAGLGGLEIASAAASLGQFQAPDLEAWSRLVGRHLGAFLLSLCATLVIWLLAMLVHAFLQGGILGVLAAGDRQAPAAARQGEWFRTYSTRHLLGWGRRLIWRMFGLWALALGLSMVWGLATAAWIGAAWAALARWGGGAGVGIGCGGALPVLFGWLVLTLWWQLGQAGLADERVGFWSCLRQALQIAGRRLGGLLLVLLVVAVAGLAINVVFMPLSMGIELALAGEGGARVVATSLLGLAQWLALSVVGILYSATLVALVRSERARPAGGRR